MKHLILAALVLCVTSLAAFAADTPRASTETKLRDDVVLFTWEGLDGDDTGVPVEVSACRHMSFHVYSGTYGSSTVTVEGTNDDAGASSAEWVGLKNILNSAISFTADGIDEIHERVFYLRPKSASGSSADIDVGLLCQKY